MPARLLAGPLQCSVRWILFLLGDAGLPDITARGRVHAAAFAGGETIRRFAGTGITAEIDAVLRTLCAGRRRRHDGCARQKTAESEAENGQTADFHGFSLRLRG